MAAPWHAPLTTFDVVKRGGGRNSTGPRRHINIGFELTWVEEGGIDFEVGDTRHSVNAGQLVFIPPDIEHEPIGRGGVLHQVNIARAFVDEAMDALGPASTFPAHARLWGSDARITQLVQLISKGAERGLVRDDPELDALVHAATLRLVRTNGDHGNARRIDRRIRRALDRIHADFSSPLTVDVLAAEAGMTRFVFLRTFRSHVGESPYQHLVRVRLDHAAAMLRSRDCSVLDVALACGFQDPGRFAAMFKRRFGCLPRAYRTI